MNPVGFPRRYDTYADGSCGPLRAVDTALPCLLHLRGVLGFEFLPHVFLAATQLRCINGNEQTFDSTLLGMLDNSLGNFAVLVHVKLEELDLARSCSIHDLVKRA